MQYSNQEVQALNLLSDNPEYSKRFATPRDLKLVTVFIVLAVFCAITVAVVFKVDKIVPAKGMLETQAELFSVRNNQQGYVSHVHVKEGDYVERNALLVSFDTELLDLEIASLETTISGLERALWGDYHQLAVVLPNTALKELVDRISKVPSPDATSEWSASLSAPISKALEQNTQAIEDTELQVAKERENLLVQRQALNFDEEQLKRLSKLYELGIESRVNLENQQRQVIGSQAQVDNYSASIELLEHQIKRLITDKNKLISDFKYERLERFHNNLDSYHQSLIELDRQQSIRSEMIITAPISGTVDGVALTGPGELISANSTVINLRPEFDRNDLLIEIQIPSSYAVWVEQGMEFRASAQGNNPDDHGYLNGEVEFISESTAKDNQAPQRMYRMIGRITKFDLSERGLQPAFLRPGMELNVEIKAGKRRLINYIFDPFTKHFRTAFSEPG